MPSLTNTKQFVIFFLLVTVFLVAISIVTSLIWREATTTYDVSGVAAQLEVIIHQSAEAIAEQEFAVQYWIDEVEQELMDAAAANDYYTYYAHEVIHPAP